MDKKMNFFERNASHGKAGGKRKAAPAGILNGIDADVAQETLSAHYALRETLTKDNNGVVAATHANCILILRGDPLLARLVRLDEFAGHYMLMHAPPYLERGENLRPGPYPRQLDDVDITQILSYVQKVWSRGFRRSTVKECIPVRGREIGYHPVRDYLDGLVWDRVARADRWLTETFGVELNDYHKAVGSKLLIAAVRRIRQPGCKFDHLVVLEGPEGIQKSTAVAHLFGSQWTTDDMPRDITSKDASIALSGVWCIELGEISQILHNPTEAMKNFLSRGVDRYRPPYGTDTMEFPRQCVMVGTTNRDDYLRDVTGNRRIWPVKCLTTGGADIEWLDANRDQLWAEAAYRETKGETDWLDKPDVREQALVEQAARNAHDPWTEKVVEYLAGQLQTKIPDILDRALNLSSQFQDKRAEMRVADILKENGWQRDKPLWNVEMKKLVRGWTKNP